MPNQYKPLPPLEQIAPYIIKMWKARRTDVETLQEVLKHIDTSQYGIGLTKLKAIRKSMGLLSTQQQAHTIESIHEAMVQLWETYPMAGAREMVSLLFHEWEMLVSRSIVCKYFTVYEPHLVKVRKAGCLQRCRFWAAGVNDIWAVDQHDKWIRFGLALHTGIEPFSGKIMWMRIWHSNQNPQLILSYYLDMVTNSGYIPLVMQSDPGTENFGIANAQTMLCQWHDQSLVGTLQHWWMCVKKNVMLEIAWSQLRRHFTPGFESILEHGVQQGWYDCDNTLQQIIFQWLFIPWLQRELDAYMDHNFKVLPHGVPELIHSSPADYSALDFKVAVDSAAIEHVCNIYIKTFHAVFDLVPPTFGRFLQECYVGLHSPLVSRHNVWTLYLDLLDLIRQQEEHIDELNMLDEADEPNLDNQGGEASPEVVLTSFSDDDSDQDDMFMDEW
ncbi:hypothetical protein EDC04DRAFT_2868837 [Pisolithus marmoratus]|nr:hypothetical protein EDC04DRAFT_2868837 [Pisolithus marmoratus]